MSASKKWVIRVQFYQDSTLLCDVWEGYTLDQIQEKLKSYIRPNIEIQAVRMVRI